MNFRMLNYMTFGLSVVLSIFLLIFPEVIFFLFGVEGNESAYLISRRAAMFFWGYAAIAYFSRNSQPSECRKSIAFGIALSMLGFAGLMLFEFFRGFAGPGILLPIIVELFLSISYFSIWLSDSKMTA
jgi:hypothetical protein